MCLIAIFTKFKKNFNAPPYAKTHFIRFSCRATDKPFIALIISIYNTMPISQHTIQVRLLLYYLGKEQPLCWVYIPHVYRCFCQELRMNRASFWLLGVLE